MILNHKPRSPVRADVEENTGFALAVGRQEKLTTSDLKAFDGNRLRHRTARPSKGSASRKKMFALQLQEGRISKGSIGQTLGLTDRGSHTSENRIGDGFMKPVAIETWHKCHVCPRPFPVDKQSYSLPTGPQEQDRGWVRRLACATMAHAQPEACHGTDRRYRINSLCAAA